MYPLGSGSGHLLTIVSYFIVAPTDQNSWSGSWKKDHLGLDESICFESPVILELQEMCQKTTRTVSVSNNNIFDRVVDVYSSLI